MISIFYENSRDTEVYSLYIDAFITFDPILSELSFPFAMLWRQNFEILKDATGESLHHMFHSFSFPLALSPNFFLPRSILCSPGPSHAGIQAVSLGPCFRPQPPPPFPTSVVIQCNSGLKHQVLGVEFII